MPGNGFFVLCVTGALFFCRAHCADVASAFVFSVSVSIGGGVMEYFVFGADAVVIVAVIDVFVPWVSAFFPFWSGVGS